MERQRVPAMRALSLILATLLSVDAAQLNSRIIDCLTPLTTDYLTGNWWVYASVVDPNQNFADKIVIRTSKGDTTVNQLASNVGDKQNMDPALIFNGPLKVLNSNRQPCTKDNNFVLLLLDINEFPSATVSEVPSTKSPTKRETFTDVTILLSPTGLTLMRLYVGNTQLYGGLRNPNDQPLYYAELDEQDHIHIEIFDPVITLSEQSNYLQFEATNQMMAYTFNDPYTAVIASTTSQLTSHLMANQKYFQFPMGQLYQFTVESTWSFDVANGNESFVISYTTANDPSNSDTRTYFNFGHDVWVFNATDMDISYFGAPPTSNHNRFVTVITFFDYTVGTTTRLPHTRPTLSTTTSVSTSSPPPTTSSSTAPSTTSRGTTSRGSTTEPPPPIEGSYCQCVAEQIWLDIVFVVDVSNDMTTMGLDNAIALLVSPLYSMTIGVEYFQSRIAIVSYSTQAQVVYNFTDVNDGVLDFLNIPYAGDSGTNIQSGIKSAMTLLDNTVEGRNARKVIVIIASSFRDGDTDDPQQLADEFKNSGGNIITLAYIQPEDDDIPKLAEIASPGFAFSNRDQSFTPDNFTTAFCQANCFCAPRLQVFSSTGNTQQTPDRGCFEYVTLPAVERAARNSCRKKSAVIPSVHDADKQAYLTSLAPPKAQFWLGMEKTGSSLGWTDGTPLDWTNWADGQPGSDSCVYSQQYSGFVTGWFTSSCSKNFYYHCESRPCDTTYYCL